MSLNQRLKNDYWNDAKKDNFKDELNHNVTVVLGWFLKTIAAGIVGMIRALGQAL